MTNNNKRMAKTALLAVAIGVISTAAMAKGPGYCARHPNDSSCQGSSSDGSAGGSSSTTSLTTAFWMQSDVQGVWDLGFIGTGSTITVVDDYSSSDVFMGTLDGTNYLTQHHGDWTSMEAGMVAPGATVVQRDWSSKGPVSLSSDTFNVINASYGLLTTAGFDPNALIYTKRDQSIMDAAANGTAVVSKAAGNTSGYAVDEAFPNGSGGFYQDYLNLSLIGDPGAIFVGALSSNGSTDNPASIAFYSTIAGSNTTVQNQFLVVGVDADNGSDSLANYYNCGADAGTCLYGTSFAAPIVAGYAAILGQKFTTNGTPPDAALIAQRMLDKTRTDTLVDLGAPGWSAEDMATYGQGEACLSCALSPDTLN